MAGLLDLPATALASIASSLGISDKKSLALTCKAMPPIIRPLWKSLRVDLASEASPPASLATFSGIRTIVAVDSRSPPVLATSTEPAFYNERPEETGGVYHYTNATLDSVCSVIDTILTAAETLETGERRELTLRMGFQGIKTGGGIQLFIQSISSKKQHDASDVALAGLSMLLAASSLLPGGNAAVSSARHTRNSSSATAEAAVLRGYINKLVSHPAFTQIPSNINAAPQIMVSRAISALDHIHHLSNGGSPYYPFTSVDAGWFMPDGYLTDIITKGSVSWYDGIDNNPDDYRLDLYTRLHTLRLCVIDVGDLSEDLDAEFARVITQINALSMLRELHLLHGDDGSHLSPSFPPNLVLPELTRLVLGKGFEPGDSFEELTHLCKLQRDMADSKHYLHHLAPLSSLCDLKVANLIMIDWQNIHTLTALTSLRLPKLHEYDNDIDFDRLGSVILPHAPMPMLRKLHLEFSVKGAARNAYNFHQSNRVVDWVLRNGAVTFPAIETMRLGVLQFPAVFDTELFTVHQAAHLMDIRVQDLFANSPNLKCLAIDQALEQKQVLDAGIPSGELGNVLQVEVAIRTGGSRSVKWQRVVQFEWIPIASRVVQTAASAHFEYTRMPE